MNGHQLKSRLQHLLSEIDKLSKEELDNEVLTVIQENGYCEGPKEADVEFEISIESGEVIEFTMLKDEMEDM